LTQNRPVWGRSS